MALGIWPRCQGDYLEPWDDGKLAMERAAALQFWLTEATWESEPSALRSFDF